MIKLPKEEATYPDQVIQDVRDLARKTDWEGDWLSIALVYIGCGICQELSELTDAVMEVSEVLAEAAGLEPTSAARKKSGKKGAK